MKTKMSINLKLPFFFLCLAAVVHITSGTSHAKRLILKSPSQRFFFYSPPLQQAQANGQNTKLAPLRPRKATHPVTASSYWNKYKLDFYGRNICKAVDKPACPPVVSVDEAMQLVKSGSRVLLPIEVGASQNLLDGLVRHSSDLKGKKPIEVIHTATTTKDATHVGQNPQKLVVNSLFINGCMRKKMCGAQNLKVTPVYLGEAPKLLKTRLKPDVLFLKVSPPDKRGYVSLGTTAGFEPELISDPKVTIIAEVNPHVPRTRGHTMFHISHIDRLVKGTEPLIEHKWGDFSPVQYAIAKNVATRIPSGSTLQLGIGPIQKAVAEEVAKRGQAVNAQGGKYKVRVRSEIIDDGLLDLAKAGVIYKDRNAIQIGFALGTQALYHFLEKDKRVKVLSTGTINDPYLTGMCKNLMAVNSAITVDLYGQACSEMVPRKQANGEVKPVPYSGVGGQVDFFRAARRSEGGKGFLTLPSAWNPGNALLSRISLDLPQGLVVTTSRYDIDRVVTEWGEARLFGRDSAKRAQALVKIAHPAFRKQLAEEGEKRFGGDHKLWEAVAHVTKKEWQRARQFNPFY